MFSKKTCSKYKPFWGIQIIATLGETWSHNGCPKLQECGKDCSGITKNWCGTCVHENGNISTNRCPPRLDFDAHSRTESQLTLFQICSECDRIGGQRPSKLKPAGACGSKKIVRERFRKHVKNVTTKVPASVTQICSNSRLQGPTAC